jgi:Na+-driven multidrug efflux pump
MGFLPCASYAYGAERIQRFRDLLMHCAWIGSGWTIFTMIFTVGLPKYIVRALSQDPAYIGWAEQFVRNSNVITFISPIALIAQALLQALQQGTRASMVTFGTQLFPLPIFSVVLYFVDKHNPGKLFYAYPIQQAVGLFVAVPLAIGPLRDILSRGKIEGDHVKLSDGMEQPGSARESVPTEEGGIVEMTDF